MLDRYMPVKDSIMLAEYRTPKAIKFREGESAYRVSPGEWDCVSLVGRGHGFQVKPKDGRVL